MFSYCGDFTSPTLEGQIVRAARAYIQVVIIVLVLAVGTRLGADPILLLGWGTLAWLLLGRLGSAGDAGDVAAGGHRVR